METDPQQMIPTDTGPAGAAGADQAIDDGAPVLEDFEPGHASAAADSSSPEGLEAVHDVPVKVQAVLGRAKMPVGELLQMGPGHVLELDRRVGEPVDIYVNDRMIARGEVVLIDGALGVTLTEIVRGDR